MNVRLLRRYGVVKHHGQAPGAVDGDLPHGGDDDRLAKAFKRIFSCKIWPRYSRERAPSSLPDRAMQQPSTLLRRTTQNMRVARAAGQVRAGHEAAAAGGDRVEGPDDPGGGAGRGVRRQSDDVPMWKLSRKLDRK